MISKISEQSVDIARELAYAIDPVEVAKACGIEPDPWQAKALRSSSSRLILNCCRQSGKSFVAAIMSIYTALYEPGSLVLILSPSLRQSKELFRKALDVYRSLKTVIHTNVQSKLSMELETGSRIVSLPGRETTIRGFSGVRLLVVDEAARVPNDLYYAIRPMLAVSNGRIVTLSTPFGTRGWWYETWRSEDPWDRYEIPATLCPRISPKFLEEERRSIGEWWFRQEYQCEFLDAETAAFRREDIEGAFDEKVQTWAL